jgi:hypothetical protein
MTEEQMTRRTPISGRANRSDERIRLIEEAVLMVRGEWPGVATGLCETVNRATGIGIGPADEREETIERTADEAVRIVEGLYGPEAAVEVRRLAAVGPECAGPAGGHAGRRHRRLRLPSLSRRG